LRCAVLPACGLAANSAVIAPASTTAAMKMNFLNTTSARISDELHD
jgi:hypothetical protein